MSVFLRCFLLVLFVAPLFCSSAAAAESPAMQDFNRHFANRNWRYAVRAYENMSSAEQSQDSVLIQFAQSLSGLAGVDLTDMTRFPGPAIGSGINSLSSFFDGYVETWGQRQVEDSMHWLESADDILTRLAVGNQMGLNDVNFMIYSVKLARLYIVLQYNKVRFGNSSTNPCEWGMLRSSIDTLIILYSQLGGNLDDYIWGSQWRGLRNYIREFNELRFRLDATSPDSHFYPTAPIMSIQRLAMAAVLAWKDGVGRPNWSLANRPPLETVFQSCQLY